MEPVRKVQKLSVEKRAAQPRNAALSELKPRSPHRVLQKREAPAQLSLFPNSRAPVAGAPAPAEFRGRE
jgi:hypothetical protein